MNWEASSNSWPTTWVTRENERHPEIQEKNNKTKIRLSGGSNMFKKQRLSGDSNKKQRKSVCPGARKSLRQFVQALQKRRQNDSPQARKRSKRLSEVQKTETTKRRLSKARKHSKNIVCMGFRRNKNYEKTKN